MQTHVYATFVDPKDAEKAAGALLDNGVKSEDLTVIQHYAGEAYEVVNTTALNPTLDGPDVPPVILAEDNDKAERDAKRGLSTTTAGDAGIGAAKGTGWGLGVGALAALAAIFIPGVGLVAGGGALALAIGAAAATTGAGAIAGAVTGYLKDQGFEEQDAVRYEAVIANGGALMSVMVPSGGVSEATVWEMISKYNGTAFTHASSPARLI